MKTKILIIEDDAKIRKGLKLILEMNEYLVFAAENGKEGVSLAKHLLPDLIICDVMMPEMDGFEVVKLLSEDEKTAVIPFLFLTAKTELKDIRTGLSLGADDYLVKPVKEEELLNSIKLRLGKIKKLEKVLSQNSDSKLTSVADSKLTEDSKIMINYGNNPVLIEIKNITFIGADNQYSKLHLHSNEIVITNKSLSQWEKILPENIFIRIHRSSIVNLNQIKKLTKWSSNTVKVEMKNYQEPLYISQGYYKKIKSKLYIN